MEQIRGRARDGLLAAPRVGMAVGGLLLGVREKSRIRLLDSVELPCSHSTGPSFNLTPEEKQQSRELVAEANLLSNSSKVGVIGWYCSKTRGDAVLSESDLSLFAELFPGSGQLALVLRPDVTESMRAVFFFRDDNGAVVKGLECEVDEWSPAPQAAEPEPEIDAEAEGADVPVEMVPEPPKVVEIRQPPPKVEEQVVAASVAVPTQTKLQDVIGLSAVDTPVRRPVENRSAMFSAAPVLLPAPKPLSRLRIAILTTAAVFALGLMAYWTQDFWVPRPALNLTFTQLDGSLLIHWDPEALRGVDHASMYVNDGGQRVPSVIPLDRLQLTSGLLSYTPKSNRVTAKLDTGKTSAFNSWLAPEQPKPEEAKAEDSKPVQPGAGEPKPASSAPGPGATKQPSPAAGK